MNMENTIMKKLERIANKVCDSYCKFREQANYMTKADPESEQENEDNLFHLHCDACPLQEFF